VAIKIPSESETIKNLPAFVVFPGVMLAILAFSLTHLPPSPDVVLEF